MQMHIKRCGNSSFVKKEKTESAIFQRL